MLEQQVMQKMGTLKEDVASSALESQVEAMKGESPNQTKMEKARTEYQGMVNQQVEMKKRLAVVQ